MLAESLCGARWAAPATGFAPLLCARPANKLSPIGQVSDILCGGVCFAPLPLIGRAATTSSAPTSGHRNALCAGQLRQLRKRRRTEAARRIWAERDDPPPVAVMTSPVIDPAAREYLTRAPVATAGASGARMRARRTMGPRRIKWRPVRRSQRATVGRDVAHCTMGALWPVRVECAR